MKKLLIVITFLALMNCLFAQNETKIVSYIPDENEIQYFMNLYERLKSIEIDKSDVKQIESMYSSFEDTNNKYYLTYQRFLFESYLLFTHNNNVKKTVINYIDSNNIHTKLSEVLRRLYSSKEEKIDSKIRFNYNNQLFDENINFFNMQEVTVFNDTLGLMLFDNDWKTISIKTKEDDSNQQSFSLVYGGGTNSVNISLKKITNISFESFKKNEIDSNFNKERFSQYQTFELPKQGILQRSGADYVYLGIGNGKDKAFNEIQNYSSIIFLYSNKTKTGYIIDTFMNISNKNNNYDIQESLFNHLLFQSLLSFVNE